ncbi:MAG: ferritin-like domain-containing protein [Renibacterium salmoninarum]|nr:ferritin-like domain-containing protein [Renibacterium salmoninarum]
MTDRFVLDLLGVMAYGELSAFERLSSDARFSPSLRDRAVLGRMAVTEFGNFELVAERLSGLDQDVEAAMLPFQPSIDAFHERTRPADWYESIMKAYVIDTISADFYRSVSQFLDPATAQLVQQIQDSAPTSDGLQERLRQMLDDDPRLASRLALWGRRLVGEALSQAQRVSLEGAALPGADAFRAELMAALTRNHSLRMSQLGLTA